MFRNVVILVLSLLSWSAAAASAGASTLKRIRSSQAGMVQVHCSNESSSDVLVMIQGIQLKDGQKWIAPFELAKQANIESYFIKINRRKSLDEIAENIKFNLISLYRRYRGKRIHVLAFSAGGAAALVAWKGLKNYQDRIFLTTVASPLAGYSAPRIAVPFIGVFAGKFNAKMAVGFLNELSGARLSACQHFINNDCQKDRHACPNDWNSNAQILREMPCGWQNTTIYSETHSSILIKVLQSILADF